MVRVKRRNLLIKIHYKGQLEQEAFIGELKERVTELFGDFGIASFKRGLKVKKYDPKEGYMIITVNKGNYEMLMATIPLITAVQSQPCQAISIHLSGTIRGCLKELKTQYLMSVRKSIGQKATSRKTPAKLDSETKI